LSLVDNFGKTYLEVDKDGKILRKDDVNFELVSNTSSYL
jgi:hypothetical protein